MHTRKEGIILRPRNNPLKNGETQTYADTGRWT